MKTLKPADRLIVAADFVPPKSLPEDQWRFWVSYQAQELAEELEGTGVYVKLNSALRSSGFSLIEDMHAKGLRVFADLKLYDIPQTLATDGAYLRQVKPDLVTVMCESGVDAMKRLKNELPDTEVLGVTVLTTKKEGDPTLAGQTIESRVISLTDLALEAGADGIIAAPADLEYLRQSSYAPRWRDLTMNTPGIRPAWAMVAGDDQNLDRAMAPGAAIAAGADRIVIGRPIMQADNRRIAVMRTLEEIESAMAAV